MILRIVKGHRTIQGCTLLNADEHPRDEDAANVSNDRGIACTSVEFSNLGTLIQLVCRATLMTFTRHTCFFATPRQHPIGQILGISITHTVEFYQSLHVHLIFTLTHPASPEVYPKIYTRGIACTSVWEVIRKLSAICPRTVLLRVRLCYHSTVPLFPTVTCPILRYPTCLRTQTTSSRRLILNSRLPKYKHRRTIERARITVVTPARLKPDYVRLVTHALCEK